ncbi:MAG TPA: T9SS type A sorting domain-containing protein, partial [Bacteroidales bacterium]|nr:T9SS type A sorting domain-containing protein [Bacteroidales bacterium]
MKIRIYFAANAALFCFFFFSLNTSAQYYQAVKTDATYYYYDSTSMQIISARIDSVAISGTETSYFAMRQIRQTDYGCWTTNGASWLGDEIIEYPDGKTQFIFYPFSPSDSNDVYTIYSQAGIGESWRFYNYHNGLQYIEATVDHIELVDFPELADYVKVIVLNCKDTSGQIVANPINGESLMLGMNYGLLRLPKFDELSYSPKFYSFIGKTNPNAGYQVPKTLDIFDFQPGDELHVAGYSENYNYGGTYTYSTAIVSRYLSRYDYPSGDSVLYTFEYCSLTYHKNNNGVEDYSYLKDTLDQTVSPSYTPQFDTEPLEPVMIPESGWWTYPFTGMSGNSQYCPEGIPYKAFDYLMMWSDDGNGCLWPVTFDGFCNYQTLYFKGLGGPYYHCDDPTYWGKEYRDLKYFKKGDVIWGSPLACDSLMEVGMKERRDDLSIKLFPNPANDYLTIAAPATNQLPAVFQLIDNTGRVILEQRQQSQTEILNIYKIAPGCYYFRWIPKSGDIITGKLIR